MKDIVLVTGSTGFIGAAVTRRLAPEFDVIGLDTHSSPRSPRQRDSVFADLTNDDSVRTALGYVHAKYGTKLAAVVHLADSHDFSGEPSPLHETIAVQGTERLLSGLKEFEFEQFVFSSTALVHAPGAPGAPVSEDSPLLPEGDSPRSKLAAEKLVHERRGNVSATILRIAAVYDDQCHAAPLAQRIQRIYERKPPSQGVPADISHGQSFVHLDDVAEAVALSVTRRGRLPAETPILIGEPECPSYAELEQTLGELIHGEAWETLPNVRTDEHYELDISRARLLLGWKPLRSLRASLPRMVDALKADPHGFYRVNQLEPPVFPEPADVRAAVQQPHAT
jgi:nucleoside-diphosphate-sugar epimerase